MKKKQPRPTILWCKYTTKYAHLDQLLKGCVAYREVLTNGTYKDHYQGGGRCINPKLTNTRPLFQTCCGSYEPRLTIFPKNFASFIRTHNI